MWKSFTDGYIKKVDNTMYFRIAEGRRREVPLRLYRILDKRFYKKSIARFRLRRLCIGTLGLSPNYGPAQMLRPLERAAKWLIKCEYLEDWWCTGPEDNPIVHFRRRRVETQQVIREQNAARISQSESDRIVVSVDEVDSLKQWLACQHDEELARWEAEALERGFGSEFERSVVVEERSKRISIRRTRRIRQEFVRRFVECESMSNQNILIGT